MNEQLRALRAGQRQFEQAEKKLLRELQASCVHQDVFYYLEAQPWYEGDYRVAVVKVCRDCESRQNKEVDCFDNPLAEELWKQ